jgi:predicted HTH transcriptional regulator
MLSWFQLGSNSPESSLRSTIQTISPSFGITYTYIAMHRRARVPGLASRQRDVLRIAEGRGVVRRRDLVARFGVSREAARGDLGRLVTAGLLRRSGTGRGSRYVPVR